MLITKQKASEINALFEAVKSRKSTSKKDVLSAIQGIVTGLDSGKVRVASQSSSGEWEVNRSAKQSVMLFLYSMTPKKMVCPFSEYFTKKDLEYCYYSDKGIDFMSPNSSEGSHDLGVKYYDKVPLKFANWTQNDFRSSGFRVLPGAVARFGCYIGKGVILMPSFVNIGAYIGDKTIVDTWSTIGTCAQIGSKCHLSSGVGIGGSIEPTQARPVIIEDGVFIGAKSEIAEGVLIGKGSVIGMGVRISQSTKIVNRETGEVTYGEVPEYSVVVPGSLDIGSGLSVYCVVIAKRVTASEREKTPVSELLKI